MRERESRSLNARAGALGILPMYETDRDMYVAAATMVVHHHHHHNNNNNNGRVNEREMRGHKCCGTGNLNLHIHLCTRANKKINELLLRSTAKRRKRQKR